MVEEEHEDQGGTGFRWSDAWLLLSLIYARDFADRDWLRQIGDYIYHAIFTDEELEEGLVRLVQAGHAKMEGSRFAPSLDVLAWYDRTVEGKSRTYVLKDLERVEKFLGVHYLDE